MATTTVLFAPTLAFAGIGAEFIYMAAAFLFVLGLKRLQGVKTARSGNALSALGMGLAVAATLWTLGGELEWWRIVLGGLVGSIAGFLLATKVEMTSMPELVAFFNGLGGGASVAVALAEVLRFSHSAEELQEQLDALGGSADAMREEAARIGAELPYFSGDGVLTLMNGQGASFAIAAVLSILIGAVTFSGSFVAYGKLAGKVNGSRIGPLGNGVVNIAIALVVALVGWWLAGSALPGSTIGLAAFVLVLVALVLGVGLVVPIGGADMPVVISLLNSYSGIAASATGFVLGNNLLIIAGTLVGASGLILTRIMCKAMNRSLASVLFGGFGETAAAQGDSEYTSVKSTSAEEVAMLLDASRKVIIVPGYGMAVAQAQHKVRELADLLESRDCEVTYGIHPVAGRMPGHMNVLLAEADVAYEKLFDLDQINGDFKNADVAIVIGANDVCNPAANDDPASPIAGMPVLNVWDARTVVVIKRSLSAGYAGIKNDLFQLDNSLMLFADGKQAVEDLITEVKDL